MRRAARLLQGSLKQLNRSWPEIETKLSFQQTPVRTQLQAPGQRHPTPSPAQFSTGSASAAGTSGLGRQAGGQSRLDLLARALHHPPRSPGAVLAIRSTNGIGSSYPATPSSAGHAEYRGIGRQVVFAAGVSAGAFAWAAHTDQQQRLHPKQTRRSADGLTPKERARLQALPEGFIRDSAHGALTWWNAVEPSKQPLYIVTGISLAVWGLWNVPRLTGFMVHNFVQGLPPGAASRRVLPMLLANYSHSSIWHLGFNSLALLSFGPLLVQNYGAPQFLAFFASAGVASSLMAHAGRLRAAVPSGSLGMSGAVYAVVVAVATLYPKLQAQFIFLPFIPITLDVLVPGLVMMDLAGAVLGWRFMDHFGHLGGALAGYWYANWGRQLIWQQRDRWLSLPEPKANSGSFR